MSDDSRPSAGELAADEADRAWMITAIAFGSRGGRAVRPNPRVGCVLVRGGEVVGRGWHAQAGGPHAEAAALSEAGERAAGATAYVTLEPCNHYGRTAPCTSALIRAGVKRVVIGCRDPNAVAAGGVEALRAGGVAVDLGVETTACEALARVFLVNARSGRAWVRLKLAVTLDGRIAATDGTSRWVTGTAARNQVHRWRANADAVLIGSGTALADTPRLDVRGIDCDRQPTRVVIDRRLRLQPGTPLTDVRAQATLLITDRDLAGDPAATRLRDEGVELVRVPAGRGVGADGGAVWLHAVLAELLGRGLCSVLVEGGAALAAALVAADLVDRLDLFVAPKLLGAGQSLIGDLGVTTIAAARSFEIDLLERVGEDAHVGLVPRRLTCSPD